MRTDYWTKRMLYEYIDKLRLQLGFNLKLDCFPLEAKQIAIKYCKNLTIEQIPFPSQYICGMLHKGTKGTSIALNSNREECQQNFDCMHELIHFFLHDISSCVLMCSEKNIKQDAFIEWQANEGAAEFLVPYKLFIPKYLELEQKYAHSIWDNEAIEDTAKIFNVSYAVINNRIKSLETEIYQYKNGTDINSLVILSKNKAINLGLNNLELTKLYCRNCLNPIDESYKYCPICGNILQYNSSFKLDFKKRKGMGYKIYKTDFKLDENKKAIKCPRCGNKDISKYDYCKICGLDLYNRCSNCEIDPYGYYICNEKCNANSRYCHKCGYKTQWFLLGLIPDYAFPLVTPSLKSNMNLPF